MNLIFQKNTKTINRNQILFPKIIAARFWLLLSHEQSQAYFCIALK